MPEQTPATTATSPDWRAAGERIGTLIDASSSGGAVAKERAEELVRLVADLYGAGLERLLDIVHDAGHLDDAVLDALADDDLVSSLLLVHGLHPYDVATRVRQALDSVRPYLGTHGGDVELLEITHDDVVRLRLLGSCDGCPSSAVTLKLSVEGAIEAAAPEVTAIEVEEATTQAAAGPVITTDSLFSRVGSAASQANGGPSWEAVSELGSLSPGEVIQVLAGDLPIVACRIGADLFAFQDSCARCSQPMDGAVLARRMGAVVGQAVLRCPSCRAHYDVRKAGACLDEETLHLTPLPLLTEDGVSSVAVPAGAVSV